MQDTGIAPSGSWSSFPLPMTPQPFSIFSLLSGKSRKVSDGPQSTVLQYRLGTGLWAWCWQRWALSLLLPINFFLARLPETILSPVFSSRIPVPNPLPEFLLLGWGCFQRCHLTSLLLLTNNSVWFSPALCCQPFGLHCSPTVSSWIGRELEGYWESCFEESLQEFLVCEHALGVGDMKEPGLGIHCSRNASTATSNPLDESEQMEESYSQHCPSRLEEDTSPHCWAITRIPHIPILFSYGQAQWLPIWPSLGQYPVGPILTLQLLLLW